MATPLARKGNYLILEFHFTWKRERRRTTPPPSRYGFTVTLRTRSQSL